MALFNALQDWLMAWRLDQKSQRSFHNTPLVNVAGRSDCLVDTDNLT